MAESVQAEGRRHPDIPPNMPHATVPDAGSMTYVLMKVNVGCIRSLINGTP
jgi:hypothetical protein